MEKKKKMLIEMIAGVQFGCEYGCSNAYSLGVRLPSGTLYSALDNIFLAALF